MTGDADDVERLRTRVANLERLTERLAHELATPLTTVQGFARILLDGEDLAPDVRNGLERIERAGSSAMRMLQHRVDEAVAVEHRSLRLRELVRDTVTTVWGEEAPAGRGLPVDARVFGDPVGIRHALVLVLQALLPPAGEADPSGLRVDLHQARPAAYQLRIEAPGGGGATSSERADLLVAAATVLAAVGGRLWQDDPAEVAGRRSVLVELQRDVQDGPVT